MNALKTFQVEIITLALGKHEYEFEVTPAFLEALDQDLLEKGQLKVLVQIHKTDLMLKIDFDIVGKVELICDRTLKAFDYLLKTKKTIFYKYSDHEEELSDEVMLIKADTSHLNLANPIFEFIALAIPSKKIHPDYITTSDTDSDDDILVYTTANKENEPTDSNIDILDPRWEALKKLKDSL
jgi:uncharacterized metal-binding protein YceD (DUF177 family)